MRDAVSPNRVRQMTHYVASRLCNQHSGPGIPHAQLPYMKLIAWGAAAVCVGVIAVVFDHSASTPLLRAQEIGKLEQQQVIPSLDGPTLFITYCAVCHGQAADGHGPMAAILKTTVPDLTKIGRRNGGVFPLDRVQNIIAGTESSGLGHGTRQMPVWGPLFSQITSDRDYGKVRLYNVAKYLESIQKQ